MRHQLVLCSQGSICPVAVNEAKMAKCLQQLNTQKQRCCWFKHLERSGDRFQDNTAAGCHGSVFPLPTHLCPHSSSSSHVLIYIKRHGVNVLTHLPDLSNGPGATCISIKEGVCTACMDHKDNILFSQECYSPFIYIKSVTSPSTPLKRKSKPLGAVIYQETSRKFLNQGMILLRVDLQVLSHWILKMAQRMVQELPWSSSG